MCGRWGRTVSYLFRRWSLFRINLLPIYFRFLICFTPSNNIMSFINLWRARKSVRFSFFSSRAMSWIEVAVTHWRHQNPRHLVHSWSRASPSALVSTRSNHRIMLKRTVVWVCAIWQSVAPILPHCQPPTPPHSSPAFTFERIVLYTTYINYL